MGFSEYKIEFPSLKLRVDQSEEWVIVRSEGKTEKIFLHDYARFYEIPGLYEEVIYKRLQCMSPQMICSLLKTELQKMKRGRKTSELSILARVMASSGNTLSKKSGVMFLLALTSYPRPLMLHKEIALVYMMTIM